MMANRRSARRGTTTGSPGEGDATASAAATRRFSRYAGLGSVLAVAISFLALALGAYQTRLMQAQARASVWPYIAIGYHFSDREGAAEFAWRVDNNGVGPARIESVTLSLDGQPMHTWDEVFEKLFVHGEVRASETSIDNNVLPPNTNRETTIVAMRLEDREQARGLYAARERFQMDICYCSVYDDCWVAHWMNQHSDAVARCETAGTVQFEQ